MAEDQHPDPHRKEYAEKRHYGLTPVKLYTLNCEVFSGPEEFEDTLETKVNK